MVRQSSMPVPSGSCPSRWARQVNVSPVDAPSEDHERAVPPPRHPVEQEHRGHEDDAAHHQQPVADPAEEMGGRSGLRSHDRGPAHDQGDGHRDRLPAADPRQVHSVQQDSMRGVRPSTAC
jgi:hypothetical protein